MCIICCSAAGVRQPDEATLRQMFNHNSHGAGYMFARDGKVTISKGFMEWGEFIRAVRYEKFTEETPVVYHFRISTQAGVQPAMTQPFPLTTNIADCRKLDLTCGAGVAHNGVVRLTSDFAERRYSDTAHFIAEFLCYLVRNRDDLNNPQIHDAIERMTSSKWALMDASGDIATIGDFIRDDGLLFSNHTYKPVDYIDRGGQRTLFRNYVGRWGDNEDDGDELNEDYTAEELAEIEDEEL